MTDKVFRDLVFDLAKEDRSNRAFNAFVKRAGGVEQAARMVRFAQIVNNPIPAKANSKKGNGNGR